MLLFLVLFQRLSLFVELTRHLMAKNGHWLAMKGVSPQRDLALLQGIKSTIHPLSVAGLQAERHLAIIEQY